MTSTQPPLRRLLRNLRPHRRLVWLASACSVLNKLFDLAPPVLIGLAVDVVVQQNSSWLAAFGVRSVPGQLGVLAALSFLIWSAESLFEYLYALLWRNLAQRVQHELRLEAYDHLQRLEMGFFEASSSGRLLAILNDDINQLERFLDHGANELLQLITTVLAVGGAMVWLSPRVAGVAFLPIPVILWGSLHFQRRLQPRYREVRDRAGDLASRLANNLGGMLTIKSYVAEAWEQERLRQDSEAYRISNRRAIRLSAAFIPLIRFAILFAFLAILVIGGLQAWRGAIAVGTYSFLVFITQRLLWPLTSLGRTLDDYQRAMASTQRVLDLIDTPIAIPSGHQPLPLRLGRRSRAQLQLRQRPTAALLGPPVGPAAGPHGSAGGDAAPGGRATAAAPGAEPSAGGELRPGGAAGGRSPAAHGRPQSPRPEQRRTQRGRAAARRQHQQRRARPLAAGDRPARPERPGGGAALAGGAHHRRPGWHRGGGALSDRRSPELPQLRSAPSGLVRVVAVGLHPHQGGLMPALLQRVAKGIANAAAEPAVQSLNQTLHGAQPQGLTPSLPRHKKAGTGVSTGPRTST